MGIVFDGQREGSRETEVRQLHCPIVTHQNIVWLEVSVEHAVGVTVGNTYKDLVQNFLSMTESHLDADLRHVFVLVDVVFEVLVHEFKDEMQSGLIADDAFEVHDVGVADLL